ncbi:hypothetical protein E2562_014534 [Oryza meyeriana var. granulata]|uniref:F-box domain-containing protein n=1 Tax=Oryza meyeriana var. granulata TaxID=110450 RepID=A0A6G1EJ83_9ORYZ|nr:hypothetical protein E2562_014534 [Oryza meyeriana var. granulata]
MAKVAVDRSDGRLEVFKGNDFVSDELLKYIGDRSPSLKVISLSCYDSTRISMEGFTELAKKCHLLEDIVFNLSNDHVRFVQPLLLLSELHQLRRLTVGAVIGISNDEIMAILDGCPHLELLDLSNCYKYMHFHVDDAVLAKCVRIRRLKLPASYDDDGYSDDDCSEYYCDSPSSSDAYLFDDYCSD